MKESLRQIGRRLLFPGFDVHTRSRASLCPYWREGARRVLDAGCGNGYFSYLAWKSGAEVDAVSFEADSVAKANKFFSSQIETGRLRFIHQNLYDLDYPENTFDEIICYETIEHLMRDQEMVRRFGLWLKPGGVLHLCAPNKLHPENANITPSPTEDGWHVRHGYDRHAYEKLLTPAGLIAQDYVGVGSTIVCVCDRIVRPLNHRLGPVAALPFFLLTWPLWPGFCLTEPETGLSIYVRAVKRAVG